MASNESFVASLGDSGISDYWRLCDEFTVSQAAFLIVGIDPDSETGFKSHTWRKDERPAGYGAAIQALTRSLKKGRIKGTHFQEIETDINNNPLREIDGSTDIYLSIVDKDSVASWLKANGFRNGFFFPNANPDTPGYLDPNHPRYTDKLAATVNAWLAVEVALPKRSEKQTLEIWLRAHAGQFRLVDEDGNPVKQAIDECSAVANWRTVGGATKTPSA